MKRAFLYAGAVVFFAGLTAGILMLLMNIQQRKDEAKQVFFQLEPLDEDNVDPAAWGKNFRSQYESYLKTSENERTKYGGSEFIPVQKLETDPMLKRLY